jgi:lambda family phage portal protein
MVKHPFINKVYGWIYGNPSASPELATPAPDAVSSGNAPARMQWHDGEKYPGGFGYTELLVADYWTLRQRSTQLFKTNIYARGIIRRLVTNIINTGLAVEAMPDPSILGIGEDELAEWSELVENRFHLWERTPALCDYKEASTFGKLQADAKQAALVSGDVLVVLIQDERTGLPRVRLVDGDRVQSPFAFASEPPKLAPGHCIKHGVEVDANGLHVAYWIIQPDERQPFQMKSVRLPARGANGRKLAWLVYGSDKMLDEVRGEPILSIVLQSLREVDRYRDAVQRKAAMNAVLAMFIKKDLDQQGSRPIMGGAQLRGRSTVASVPGGTPKVYNFATQIPGAVLDELAPGETPHGFSATGTDEKFGDFESAIIYAIAWCLNIPPEILTLSFASNYSASQAAVNEFKLYLNPVRAAWGDAFCQPIYIDWLLSETLAGRVKAAGLLEAWRDPMQYDRLAAWLSADWTGAIKPSVDLMKQANGYEKLVEQGFITRDRATRETTGTKFSKNVKQIERENEALAKANKPIAELKKPPAPPPALPGAGPKAPKDPNAPRKLRVVPKQESSDDTLVT